MQRAETMTIKPGSTNITSVVDVHGPLDIEDVLHETIQPVITFGRNVHVFWYLFGVTGNLISIKIWTLPQMYEVCSYALYLTAISVCDLMCLFLHMFYYISFFWNVKSFQNTTLCETWTIIYMIPQYVSLFLVLGFTTQKLMAISDPFLSNRYLPKQNAAKQIVGIVIFVTTLSFPLAYLWKTENRGDCERNNYNDARSYVSDGADSHVREVQESQYNLLYWLTDIGTYVPLITLVLCFCIIIKSLKLNEGQNKDKSGRRNSQATKTKSNFHQSTLILLGLAFFRILTYLPNTVLLILRRLGYFDPSDLPVVFTISEAMAVESWVAYTQYASSKICCDIIENSHMALDVFIYILVSRQFRKELVNGSTRFMLLSRSIYRRAVVVISNVKCNRSEDV